MPEDHFGERVAARYDDDPGHVRPRGRRPHGRLPRGSRRERSRARAGDRHGANRAAARAARRPRARHRPLGGDGRAAAGEAGRRGDRRHDRRLRHDASSKGRLLARLPRLQHDHEPDDAGRAGGVLPERRRAPRAGWVLRDRGGSPGAPAASARRDLPAVHRHPDEARLRRVRHRSAGPRLAPLLASSTGRSRSTPCRSATSGLRSST